ncbi:MAG TPA: alpha/beta hydrolase domain-containing protein, partial [Casimicrobiaceae bacterium]|nr:alpha/beta hydrolase domain-containing protein [Casimicrobiaceae bacterium]
SKTDSDGNELAGVRVPDVVVPLATYTSWNVRTTAHAPGDSCSFVGSTLPFASTRAQRLASGDPRPSLEERYPTHQDYVAKVTAAAQSLVSQRLLLPDDATFLIDQANAAAVP